MEDMKQLNVKLPTVITRVSEYITEIIAYIEQIITNGFAYESNGFVFFDVEAFRSNPNHNYNKLVSSSSNDLERNEESESANFKRNPEDFVLWNKSKEGEPKWESPWGDGRPGQYIGCSAMADAMRLNPPIDIYSGSANLKFPNHNNEIA